MCRFHIFSHILYVKINPLLIDWMPKAYRGKYEGKMTIMSLQKLSAKVRGITDKYQYF